jgi:hypothetical protein
MSIKEYRHPHVSGWDALPAAITASLFANDTRLPPAAEYVFDRRRGLANSRPGRTSVPKDGSTGASFCLCSATKNFGV